MGRLRCGKTALEASACEMSPAHDLQHVLFIGDLHRGCLSYLSGANSSGKPTGGDNAALDLTGQFATFSSVGPGSASRPTQIFLAAPFF